MTTKPISGYKIKDGKLVRNRAYRAKQKRMIADRLVKAWQKTGRKK